MDKKSYRQLRQALDLKRRSGPLFMQWAIDAALITAVIIAPANQWISLTMSPLVAVLMFRSFGLMHDIAHGPVLKNPWLNHFHGVVSGALCLLPFEPWKRSHLQHHFWSGNIEKDPVMGLRVVLPQLPAWASNSLTFFWRLWIPVLGLLQHFLFWQLSIKQLLSNLSVKNILSVVVTLSFWLGVVSLAPTHFLVWTLLPGVLLYLIFVEIVNLPHHLQLPMFRGEKYLAVWEQYLTARTCLYPRWIARYFVLNFNYHAAHHMFPDAPWYTLEAVHQALQSEIGSELYTDPYLSWTLVNRPLHLLQVVAPDRDSNLRNAG